MGNTISSPMQNNETSSQSSNETSSPKEIQLIENLPVEIIHDILFRFPIDSLAHCMCVCKPWKDFIENLLLSPLHDYAQSSSTSPTSTNPIGLILYSPFDQSYFIPDLNTCETTVKLNQSPFRAFFQKHKLVGSLHGFICFVNHETQFAFHSLFLCNPVKGDCFQLPQAVHSPFDNHFFFGFGYSSNTKDYKVVQMRADQNNQSLTVEVVTVGSYAWRNIGNIPSNLTDQGNSGVFVNGCLHWLMVDGKMVVGIKAFNVEEETFRTILIPDSIVDKEARGLMYLGVVGGYLTIVDHSQNDLEVWVLKNYNVNESWFLQFIIPSPLKGRLSQAAILGVQKNGNIILECEYNSLFSYDPKFQTHQKIRVPEIPVSFTAVPHVGTLVTLTDVICREGL